MMTKRICGSRLVLLAAALVACIAAAGLPAAADPEERLEEIEERKEKVERKYDIADAESDELLGIIKVVDAERADLEARVADLDGQLASLNTDIAQAESDLSAKQQELAEIDADLKVLQENLERRVGVYTERAVAAYKSGPSGQIDALLSSESFSELFNKVEYYESALESDSELVEEIEVLQDETEVHFAEVEEKKDEIAAAKLELELNRDAVAGIRAEKADALREIEDRLATKEVVLAQIESKKSHYEDVIDELEEESQDIENLLAARAAEAAEAKEEESTGGVAPAPPVDTGSTFFWPTAGGVASPYGPRTHPIFGDTRMHTGVDIGGAYGQPVWAAESGVVAYVGVMGGYGNVVVVDHGDGLATTYNHLSAFSVSTGQQVSRGQTLAAVGCTGYCTGPHLHFEVRINGSPVDPMPYLT